MTPKPHGYPSGDKAEKTTVFTGDEVVLVFMALQDLREIGRAHV